MVDVYIYNDKRLIIDFTKNLTKIGGSTSYSISLNRDKIKIKLELRNEK